MKKIFKPIAILTMTLLFVSFFSEVTNAQARIKADIDTYEWRYDIECFGIGTTGSYLIKVWTYSKNQNVALEQCKKNAVHGVIFKGFGGGGNGCTAQKPLASNPNVEQEKMDFFKNFFADGGKYMKYVGFAGDGAVPVQDRLKVGKEYKVGVVVSVQKDNLRKDLEAAGIIKGLSSGF
ncbi:MAG: hypothetical protein PHR81_06785 [Bacteroidales bacterium]|jgi:hypothetical protein|nr:hypothetical protein [Bacteroidales bacterium]MDD4214501.1 hypothetical protein [Bacteroidales bacterium]